MRRYSVPVSVPVSVVVRRLSYDAGRCTILGVRHSRKLGCSCYLYSPRDCLEGGCSRKLVYSQAHPYPVGSRERRTSQSAVEYRRPFRKGSDRNGSTFWRVAARRGRIRPVGRAGAGRPHHVRARVAEASRRSFPEATSPARKTCAFALILRAGTPAETLLRPLGGT